MLRILLMVWLMGAAAMAVPPSKLDRLNVGSLTYSNITVVNLTPTDLYFSYEKGIKNVKLRQLDPETQKLFNYDPKAAEALERQQEEDAARFQTTVAGQSGVGTKSVASGQAVEDEKRHKTAEENVLDPISERSLIGKNAPPIKIDKWLGSAPAPTLKDKFVLLSFLAPWSLPSQKSTAQLNMVEKKFAPRLEVVGLLPEADAEDRTLDSKLEFPFATDEKNRLASALGVDNVPCVVLIDPNGVILYQGHPAALGDRELRLLMAKIPAEAK
jgi:cytochrome c biogenesis protein CcmG/thiol:disulfide interchange protein DsbE